MKDFQVLLPKRAFAVTAAAVASLAVPATLYFGGHAVASSRLFLVESVTVEGNERVAEEDILAAVGLDMPRNVLTCDANEMASTLEQLPWVHDAQVTIGTGGIVSIVVEEAPLRGMVVTDTAYLMDADGRLVREWQPADGVVEPIFVGITMETEAGTVVIDEALRGAEARIAAFEATSLGGRHDVVEVQHDPLLGYSLVLDDGARIRMAHDRVEARLARVEELYHELEARGETPGEILADGASVAQIPVRLNNNTHAEMGSL